jgi:hypothetical protein
VETKWWTLGEAAHYSRYSIRTIRGAAAISPENGGLRTLQVTPKGRHRTCQEWVDAWLLQQTNAPRAKRKKAA